MTDKDKQPERRLRRPLELNRETVQELTEAEAEAAEGGLQAGGIVQGPFGPVNKANYEPTKSPCCANRGSEIYPTCT